MQEVIRSYSGKEAFQIDDSQRIPIVEGFLYENDYVIIYAKPKLGKTVLCQQLACCLTSGTDFLDFLSIPNPVRIWYFALEGKDIELKDRFIRLNKTIPVNYDNFHLFCSASIRFNTPSGQKLLEDMINKADKLNQLPKVIFIDSLYKAIHGSTKDDAVVNNFNESLGRIADLTGAAIIAIHHEKKTVHTMDGSVIQHNDSEGIHGSIFLLAAADQIYQMEKARDLKKGSPLEVYLKCDTQRSGKVIETLRLKMTEPDPLYFESIELHESEEHRILEVLKNKKLYAEEIIKRTKLSRAMFYRLIKNLTNDKRVIKSELQDHKIYYFLGDKKEGVTVSANNCLSETVKP